MIDVHSHALYDCDDGSKDLNQTIEMLRCAKKCGFTAIFFTPHYMEDGYKNDKNDIHQKIDIVRESIKKEKIDIKLYKGEEVFIYPKLDEDFDKVIFLNDSKYILIELPMIEKVGYLDDMIYKILSNGKVPIIAHPERYLATRKDISFVEELINKGALIQMNINSIVGHYGEDAKKIAKQMLKRNMVHFVASDAHSFKGYEKTLDSLKALKKIVSEEKFYEITCGNQLKVIRNEDIVVEKVIPKHKCGFLSFLKGGV